LCSQWLCGSKESMTKQFTLGKQERLKSRKLIEELFSKGQRISVFPYRVFYLFQQKDSVHIKKSLQFGAGAGTRNFKKAVDRNRIKRLTREAWRLQNTELKKKLDAHTHAMAVFFIYTGKELPAFDFVKEKTALIIEKLLTVADENHPPHT
jgi:ribonuclease P protein component